MAAAECETKESTSLSADLLKTPVLSDETVSTIERQEGSGLPLQTPWTFWLDKAIPGTTAEEYKANLQKIYTVNTVQNFWAVFNNIPNAGDMQERVWKEVVLAAIGEQFTTHVAQDDEVCGVTVSIRDREDLIQIWNINAAFQSKATVLKKVHSLLPDVNFLGEFYKEHQSNHAYGRR
ncbi:eukaryotic translation initiation factor 4E type 3 isoform X2 [Camponotus floridanus]|uniref:eukaryotic translation initiation factor 4E type 3 isoform X2 n=1 Tax=Camponotus floridanus TaxID=104421 RepID=UPI00059B749E|nr:eukaryotic translation initiation factor 4E type 3 isoform X2 [Camponotus floridanus]